MFEHLGSYISQQQFLQEIVTVRPQHNNIGLPLFGIFQDCISGIAISQFGTNSGVI